MNITPVPTTPAPRGTPNHRRRPHPARRARQITGASSALAVIVLSGAMAVTALTEQTAAGQTAAGQTAAPATTATTTRKVATTTTTTSRYAAAAATPSSSATTRTHGS